MQGETSNDRWQELVDLREELEHGDAVLPTRISAIDGRRIEASPEAVRFAEALAFNAGWSGISEARRPASVRRPGRLRGFCPGPGPTTVARGTATARGRRHAIEVLVVGIGWPP